jgi:uncharacterized membrane protein
MSQMRRGIASMMMAGLLLLIPIAITVLVIVQIVDLLIGVVEPVAKQLPVAAIAGIDVAYLVVILLMLGLCLVVGWIVQTSLGKTINEWFEAAVLNRLPGYSLAKNLTRGIAGQYSETPFPVALARIHGGEAAVLALVIEEHADGRFTIFVPQSPTPTLGMVYVVGPELIEIQSASAASVLNSTMQWGIGTSELLDA